MSVARPILTVSFDNCAAAGTAKAARQNADAHTTPRFIVSLPSIVVERSLARCWHAAKHEGTRQGMIEQILDIPTKDGAVETFICHPERGSHPPVLLLMDAPGIREELYEMARRLATVGYYVLLPNLYYRAGKDTKYGPDVLTHGSAEHTRMRAVRTKMTIPPVMDDVAALIAFADRQPAAKKGPVGAHGYCMSGPYALAAAARYPDRVAAAASFYGTWLVSDAEESPHLNLGKARGELYISCAERHWERLIALYRRRLG